MVLRRQVSPHRRDLVTPTQETLMRTGKALPGHVT